jgi:hypothetical protein
VQAEDGLHVVQDAFLEHMVCAGVALLGRLKDELYCALRRMIIQKGNFFNPVVLTCMIYWNSLLISATFKTTKKKKVVHFTTPKPDAKLACIIKAPVEASGRLFTISSNGTHQSIVG